MKTILNPQDKAEILSRLSKLTPQSKGLWGTMNPGQAVCHLNDELRFILGQKTGATEPNFFCKTYYQKSSFGRNDYSEGKSKSASGACTGI
ncbi:MAG: hypothetical protein V4642_15030 [Bacteroidota bacterium]